MSDHIPEEIAKRFAPYLRSVSAAALGYTAAQLSIPMEKVGEMVVDFDGIVRSAFPDPVEPNQQEWKQRISAALGVKPGEMNYKLAGAVEQIEDLVRDSAARARERDRYSQVNQDAAAWRVIANHPLIGDISTLPDRGTYADRVRARLDELAADRQHGSAVRDD